MLTAKERIAVVGDTGQEAGRAGDAPAEEEARRVAEWLSW